ncbi:MAG TPA: phospholipase C, phosphocholine-specific [Candidatus Aquilonibacter sp.]|nr:phospholipase C, phosphocholine-specific [Candidatus Aquilonibacter sp.]
MQTRRDFLKRALVLSTAAGFSGVFSETIQRALAIDPAPHSTFLDAEHVVILMQENRSFDHALGMLRGVRGFNDPRAFRLANNNPVWLQTNAKGETYAPFRLNIHDTRATWMSYLPHARETQVDAWDSGQYNQWLEAKRSHKKEYADMPLTLGHYTREDIPFYYALADAFTVCDQNFSGVMTSTTPNRAMFWTGTLREQQNAKSPALIRNYNYSAAGSHWETFPEILQRNGISWKFYQNEVGYLETGLSEEEDVWLSNFGCNNLELFAQYHINYLESYQQHLPEIIARLKQEIAKEEAGRAVHGPGGITDRTVPNHNLATLQKSLAQCEKDLQLGPNALAKLPLTARELHHRAFVTNLADPDYHQLTQIDSPDGKIAVPKGDIFHQFREDVRTGNLPTVTWMAAPENFSDHPISPWYGAWYVSEVMNILTQNPEVWKKTIFILTYDENDGYFDHIPPYTAPDPRDPSTGKASPGLNYDTEYVYRDDELAFGIRPQEARTGPVGLGFRVPMIVASPWSRGGWVNSQLFEHTSVNQFLEHFVNTKFNRAVRETNISSWRRAISGNLTTVFRPFDTAAHDPLPFVHRDPYIETLYKAKFQPPPSDFHILNPSEIAAAQQGQLSTLMGTQEPGTRPSCALPYELYAEVTATRTHLTLECRAANQFFGKQSLGSPFNVYLRNLKSGSLRSISYAVAAGDTLRDTFPLDAFVDRIYHIEIHGPNGFFREFQGDASTPSPAVLRYASSAGNPTGNILLQLSASDTRPLPIRIEDCSYGASPLEHTLTREHTLPLDLQKSSNWYDIRITAPDHPRLIARYAGRVETGQPSISDPFMGRVSNT